MDKQDFQALWDKAQESGLFGEAKPKPKNVPQYNDSSSEVFESPEAKYWRDVYNTIKVNGGEDLAPDPLNLISEEATTSKEDLKKFAQSSGPNANPVTPWTVGKDQDYDPQMADVAQLEQLHDMKCNLQELEAKLNAKTALGETAQGKKVQRQINALRTQIDNLSDALTPDFLDHYYVDRNDMKDKISEEENNKA